jgi:tetratricopeptide (TPR) repeat protein
MKFSARFLPLALLLPTLAYAQSDPNPGLGAVFQLEREGRFSQVVEAATPIATASNESKTQRAQAWMLIGIAYHQQGKFQQSASAYDQALHLLGNAEDYPAQYAAGLISYGTLYHDMGRTAEAEQLQKRALQLYTEHSDLTGMAMAYKSLAGIELGRGHTAEGRKLLQQAVEKARTAPELNSDFFASLASMQGKLAELQRNPADAVAAYQHALELWRSTHGERHALVGWGYVLLGKATAATGSDTEALLDIRKGLLILDHTVGQDNVHYFAAELADAQVLDASGAHDEAKALKQAAQTALQRFYQGQCLQCSVSATALAMR